MADETVCYCRNVSKGAIVEAIRNGARDLKDIQKATGACTGNRCKELNPKGRCCSVEIAEIIKQETGSGGGSGCCCCRPGKRE